MITSYSWRSKDPKQLEAKIKEAGFEVETITNIPFVPNRPKYPFLSYYLRARGDTIEANFYPDKVGFCSIKPVESKKEAYNIMTKKDFELQDFADREYGKMIDKSPLLLAASGVLMMPGALLGMNALRDFYQSEKALTVYTATPINRKDVKAMQIQPPDVKTAMNFYNKVGNASDTSLFSATFLPALLLGFGFTSFLGGILSGVAPNWFRKKAKFSSS
ncbi:hypothetical protein HZA33_02970 [Candidatus Pacearchaeota archaeon]|nr:hypothetical protein [Candidatus Pacearchaeota archaeon]